MSSFYKESLKNNCKLMFYKHNLQINNLHLGNAHKGWIEISDRHFFGMKNILLVILQFPTPNSLVFKKL